MSATSSLSQPDVTPKQHYARWRCVLANEATFAQFCSWFVRIESDSPGQRGAIPLALYPYQRERAEAWERGDSEIILKARQLGFTWEAAAFALWTAAYHESAHVAIFSAGQREVRKFLRRVRYIWRRLPPQLRVGGQLGVDSVSFPNESVISGFPSTEDAGIGETNRLVIFDEWAFHPYGEANLSAVLPTIANGGQLIAMSTADPSLGPAGHFYEQWSAAVDGETGITPVFVPWHARPGRDLAWLDAQRARHKGSEQAFRAFYPSSPEEAFEGAEGLVYGADQFGQMAWDAARIKAPPCTWRECKWRIGMVDPGGGDPSAVLLIGVSPKEQIHVYGEMHVRGAISPQDAAHYLSQAHNVAPLDLVACDPSQASFAKGLQQLGFKAFGADNDKLEGIGNVRRALLDGRLTVGPENKQLIHEMGTYWWPTRKHMAAGGKASDTRTPADHHADCVDCLRYGVQTIIKGLPNGPRRVQQRWDSGIPKEPESFRDVMEARRKVRA